MCSLRFTFGTEKRRTGLPPLPTYGVDYVPLAIWAAIGIDTMLWGASQRSARGNKPGWNDWVTQDWWSLAILSPWMVLVPGKP